jgi:hypothetical protein
MIFSSLGRFQIPLSIPLVKVFKRVNYSILFNKNGNFFHILKFIETTFKGLNLMGQGIHVMSNYNNKIT